MRRVLILFAAALQLGAAVSPEYAQRREKLRSTFSDGVLVLFGAKESEDLHYGFFQDTNFLYLTGWEEPGAILIVTPAVDQNDPAAAERSKFSGEILLLPQRVPREEKWTGRKLGPLDSNVADSTGFTTVLPAERLESELRRLLESYPNLLTVGVESTERLKRMAATSRTPLYDSAISACTNPSARSPRSSTRPTFPSPHILPRGRP